MVVIDMNPLTSCTNFNGLLTEMTLAALRGVHGIELGL